MPIKDKSAYPENWTAISQSIRQRAHDRCEVCGLPNGAFILRSRLDLERVLILSEDGYRNQQGGFYAFSEIPEEYEDAPDVKVVLTVHHKDENPMNNADDNLACLCQLHHLRADAQRHARTARRTRLNKRRQMNQENGQKELFDGND